MNSYLKKSLTLIELLIAISLLSVIILAVSNIDLFTHFHVISADRRVKLQNEVSVVLEHMSKEISRAIGNRSMAAKDPISFNNIAGDTAIRVFIDLGPQNPDGSFQPGDGRGDPQTPTQNDRWSAYRFTGAAGNLADRFQIWYYPIYVNPASTYEVIAGQILSPNPLPSATDNYVDISITACWQPAQTASPDNPEVVMRTKIKMPSVSTN